MNLNSTKALFIAGTITAVVFLLTDLSVRLYVEILDLRAHRAAVADVENFIYQKYPLIDAATRRGHAEILIDSSCVDVGIVENTMACPNGITRQPPQDVRKYALRVAEAHKLK